MTVRKARSAERKVRKVKHYIHVNRLRMLSNRNGETTLPVIAVRRGRSGKPRYYRKVTILGPSQVVYDPEHPLCIGAQVWVESEAELICEGEVHDQEDDHNPGGGGNGRDTVADENAAQGRAV
jgi:hypothetical protein